jgi:hypothetical protein
MASFSPDFTQSLTTIHHAGRTIKADYAKSCTEVTYHPLVKILLLAGYSANEVARFYRTKRKTISDIATTPFTSLAPALVSSPSHWQVFNDLWDGSPVTARGALNACLIYDTTHFPVPDTPALTARYGLTPAGALRQVQQVYARAHISGISDDNPTMSLDTVETVARTLACTDQQIQTATDSITEWLSTPIVPETPDNVFYHSGHPLNAPGLAARFARLRHEREMRELNEYGSCRPTVNDASDHPAALARDQVLHIIGEHSGIAQIPGRDQQLRTFSSHIGVPLGGMAGWAGVADSPDGLVDRVDQAVYDAEGVHLPHVTLADDHPWPANDHEL